MRTNALAQRPASHTATPTSTAQDRRFCFPCKAAAQLASQIRDTKPLLDAAPVNEGSQENVEVVRKALGAVNRRDVGGYLALCTDDIQLHSPLTPVEGAHQGAEGVRRFFADIEAAAPDFRLDIERLESVGADRVIAFLHGSASGRASAVPLEVPVTNIYDLAQGKIRRVQAFLDRKDALEAMGCVSRRGGSCTGDVGGEMLSWSGPSIVEVIWRAGRGGVLRLR